MGRWFGKFYDTLMEPLERRKFRDIRQKLVSKAQGKVLEIGSGTGLNFPYYKQAEKVIAIEPNPIMRDQSRNRAKQSQIPIEIYLMEAEKLPFTDNSFDTVVGTLVLCTIPDPEQAIKEIRRVCKPGGQVLFFEHVRLNKWFLGGLQDFLTPVWKRLCDGCHLNRNTLETIKESGLQLTSLVKYYKDIFLVIESINRK